MHKFIYQLSYLFNLTPWNPSEMPCQLAETLTHPQLVKGIALDIGCGTGAYSFYLAEQGWQVIGIDYVHSAIQEARKQASRFKDRVEFKVGDITQLASMNLPKVQLVIDIKCSHGLSSEQHKTYVEGLTSVMDADSLLLLEALYPRSEMGVRFGQTPEEVQGTFGGYFKLLKSKQINDSGWYWFQPK